MLKGVPGILRPFRDFVEGLGLGEGDQVVYVGVPGTCTPFVELLAFATRSLPVTQIFVPGVDEGAARRLEPVPNVGVQAAGPAGPLRPRVIVVMGGLSMENSPVGADEVIALLDRHPTAAVVGVCFQQMFEKDGVVRPGAVRPADRRDHRPGRGLERLRRGEARPGRTARRAPDHAGERSGPRGEPSPVVFQKHYIVDASLRRIRDRGDMSMVEINPLDVIGTLEHDGNFSNLLRAIRDAGLEETLKGAGPFTIFAPEDTAFESAQAGAMRWIRNDTTRARQVLTHHVVKDRLLTSALDTARPLRALDGSDLQAPAARGARPRRRGHDHPVRHRREERRDPCDRPRGDRAAADGAAAEVTPLFSGGPPAARKTDMRLRLYLRCLSKNNQPELSVFLRVPEGECLNRIVLGMRVG